MTVENPPTDEPLLDGLGATAESVASPGVPALLPAAGSTGSEVPPTAAPDAGSTPGRLTRTDVERLLTPEPAPSLLVATSVRRRLLDRGATVAMTVAFLLALAPLVWILWTVVAKGGHLLVEQGWWSETQRGITSRRVGGGALHAIIGTLLQAERRDPQRVDEQRGHDRRHTREDVDHEADRAGHPGAGVLDQVDGGEHAQRQRDHRGDRGLQQRADDRVERAAADPS